jgi:2-polyprenyl-3-methyl-5-hydroxy-6-metoxy-1,4-benzoquinol methylase
VLQCPVCHETDLFPSVTKADVRYLECATCEALFAPGFDPDVIQTHNQGSACRADPQEQATRLNRLCSHLGRRPRKILDFGCGLGQYLEYLWSDGFEAVGVDQDTELQLSDFKPGDVDAINMVEVIEHLLQPREVLGRLIDILEPGGVLYAESSFTNHLGDPADSPYINPRIGHWCIHSVRSIEYLAWYLRVDLTWANNNVFVFRKR